MAAVQTSSSTQPVHDSHKLQNSALLIMKYLFCTIPSLEALGQLLFGTTTIPFPSHPQVHGYSWFADKLDRLVFNCTIIAPAFCKKSLVPSPAIFPNPKHHRKLAFETQKKPTAFILSSPSMLEFSLTSQFIIKTILQQHLQGIM